MSTTFLAACSANSNVSSMCWNAQTVEKKETLEKTEMTSTEFIIAFVIFMSVVAVAVFAADWITRRREKNQEDSE